MTSKAVRVFRKTMGVLRKPVGKLPTSFVLAAAVFAYLLAPHPIRVLVISLVGGIVLFLLAWANQRYKSKREPEDPCAVPPYSLN